MNDASEPNASQPRSADSETNRVPGLATPETGCTGPALVSVPVTRAESQVLGAIWRLGPLSFPSLIEEVKTGNPWGDATIKTLLHRLIDKGAVRSVRENGRQRYHALIDRESYIAGEIGALVAHLFNGDTRALKAFLTKSAA